MSTAIHIVQMVGESKQPVLGSKLDMIGHRAGYEPGVVYRHLPAGMTPQTLMTFISFFFCVNRFDLTNTLSLNVRLWKFIFFFIKALKEMFLSF